MTSPIERLASDQAHAELYDLLVEVADDPIAAIETIEIEAPAAEEAA